MTARHASSSGGFSLMEVVISVAIVGIVIPTVMALMVTGGRGSSEAADETRAILMVRSVLEELDRAREGKGEMLEGVLSWPDFPQGAERFVFTADRSGKLLAEAEAETYATGSRELEVAFLVTLKGERHLLESVPAANDLSKVEITIETPPGAGEADRRKLRFVRLLHTDD
ncbi:MAG: type II secretion system protein [Akkermansiaceae bacterium]|nr:type II secretion system protein [Akkermansiaceae bacterium]